MIPRLWAITDPALGDDELVRRAAIAAAIAKGALCIHLRDKARGADALAPIAARLRAATRAHGAWLAIGDHPALADAVDADVAHGWAGRAARGTWSVPAHSDDDVRRALAARADVVLVSPIFATPGKGAPRGAGAISSARALAPGLRVYALGGIDATNARACVAAGAHGVAVIRALLGADDVAVATRALLDALRAGDRA